MNQINKLMKYSEYSMSSNKRKKEWMGRSVSHWWQQNFFSFCVIDEGKKAEKKSGVVSAWNYDENLLKLPSYEEKLFLSSKLFFSNRIL